RLAAVALSSTPQERPATPAGDPARWGKVLDVTACSQSYPDGGEGWCSPTSPGPARPGCGQPSTASSTGSTTATATGPSTPPTPPGGAWRPGSPASRAWPTPSRGSPPASPSPSATPGRPGS